MSMFQIPIFSDQGVNANMLARHGGALVYDKFDLPDAEKLTQTFKKILKNPEFKKAADRLSDILHHQPSDPKQVLLNHCEFSARFGEVKSLEPHANKYDFFRFYCIDVLLLVLSVITVAFVLFCSLLRLLLKKLSFSSFSSFSKAKRE